jgi:competence protein ComEA
LPVPGGRAKKYLSSARAIGGNLDIITVMRLGLTRIIPLAALLIAGFAAPAREADAPTRSSRLVDINHATASELKALPGIQDAYAAAIVRNRPYKNKAQLLSKQIIPEAAYAKIRNKIIAKQ